MKKFSLLSALLAITAFLMTVSCEKPDPVTPDGPGIVNPGDDNNEENPEEEKPESGLPEAAKANTYVINGTEYAFSSTAIISSMVYFGEVSRCRLQAKTIIPTIPRTLPSRYTI